MYIKAILLFEYKVYKKLYAENNNLPSLRLANLTYFKQELTIDTYIEEVVSKAKVVVLKLLGGTAYFSYLCEAISDYAEENDIHLNHNCGGVCACSTCHIYVDKGEDKFEEITDKG